MKNVIIGGTVRAGKTTLANKIARELHYSTCESDTIVHAFHKVFPQLGIVHNKPEQAREKYKPFLFEVLNGFLKNLKYCNMITVFPGSQFLPKHINEYSKKDKYIVIFLGINDVSAKELLATMRELDTENDWTHKETDEALLKHCQKIIKESNELEQECKKYGFYYFNTSKNRAATFDIIVDMIKKKNIN